MARTVTELTGKLVVLALVALPLDNVTAVPKFTPLVWNWMVPGATAPTVAVKLTDWRNTDGFADEVTPVVVSALLTVWVTLVEVLVAYWKSPPYTALIVWLPTDSDELVRVACPDPSSVPVPSVAAPSLNVTVPVGVPTPAVPVAVNTTDWTNTGGFCDELTVVVVGWPLTVWVKLVEVLPLKLSSPLYTAVMMWFVIDRDDVGSLAAVPPDRVA